MKLLGLLMASTLLTAPAGLAAAAKANGAAAVAATSQGDRPWMNTALSPDERARLAVEAMTLDEQISLMRTQIGFGLLSLGIPLPDSVPETMRKHTPEGALGSAGFIPAVPRLDLPAIQMTDASLGVGNLGGFLRRGDEATALPSSLALAGSFNTDLARQAGRVVGAEAHAKGFNVQLAGGVNLTREPRNGRNFEYAGEDPLLAGLIIGETIAGIQDEHVVSTSKHYALNSQETGRFVYDARIDEGALRESDLLAFEIAHDRGQPGAVMCAYNRINGVYGCESPFLLKQVLKTEWKYPGWVMSDWGAVHSLTPALDAGLDQESPQDNPHFTTLKAEVEAGRVPASRVAESARRILRSLFAVGAVDSPAAPGGAIDKDAHAAVAEQIALQGMVLLKNEGGVLPLAATAKRIVVIGGFADRGVIAGGGGSSQVMPYGGSFRDTRGREGVAALLTPVYGLDSPLKALQARRPDADIQFDDGSDPARAAALARTADIAIVFATRPEEEGLDAENLLFPHGQDDLIAAVAAANPRTVAVLETGNPTAMPWLSHTAAVLQGLVSGPARRPGHRAPADRRCGAVGASADDLPRLGPATPPAGDPRLRSGDADAARPGQAGRAVRSGHERRLRRRLSLVRAHRRQADVRLRLWSDLHHLRLSPPQLPRRRRSDRRGHADQHRVAAGRRGRPALRRASRTHPPAGGLGAGRVATGRKPSRDPHRRSPSVGVLGRRGEGLATGRRAVRRLYRPLGRTGRGPRPGADRHDGGRAARPGRRTLG